MSNAEWLAQYGKLEARFVELEDDWPQLPDSIASALRHIHSHSYAEASNRKDAIVGFISMRRLLDLEVLQPSGAFTAEERNILSEIAARMAAQGTGASTGAVEARSLRLNASSADPTILSLPCPRAAYPDYILPLKLLYVL